MELEGNYSPLGMQIEGPIRKKYEDSFENLRKANSCDESLEFIASMFEALGKSRPDRSRGVDWARDIIDAYRTLEKIFRKAYSEYLESEGENSKLEELTEEYQDLLLDFRGKTEEEKIKQALEYLSEVKKILGEYDIGNIKELETGLERLKNLEERSEGIEDVEGLQRDIEFFGGGFD